MDVLSLLCDISKYLQNSVSRNSLKKKKKQNRTEKSKNINTKEWISLENI